MNRTILNLCGAFGILSIASPQLDAQPGTVDTTFNTFDDGRYGDGAAYPGAGNAGIFMNSSCLQSDGKLVLGNVWNYNLTTGSGMMRLNTDGSIDPLFNISNVPNNAIHSLQGLPGGKILVGGAFTQINGADHPRIARLDGSGQIDTAFQCGAGPNSAIACIAVQADGKILVGGAFTQVDGIPRNCIARLEADGALDLSFDPGSGVSGGSPTSGVNDIAVQPDGKVLISGRFTLVDGNLRKCIARLEASGAIDPTFDPGAGPVASGSAVIATTVLEPDGRVLIGGNFTSFQGTPVSRSARLNADGSLADALTGTVSMTSVDQIQLAPDSSIIAIGLGTYVPGALVKMKHDGSVDSSFHSPNITGGFRGVHVRPDGRIIATGLIGIAFGIDRWGPIQMLPNGDRDWSFNPGAGIGVYRAHTNVVLDDQRILIGGQFTSYNGFPRQGIARLTADGNLDTSFVPATFASQIYRRLSIQPDGKTIAAGSLKFTSYGPQYSSLRFNTDGSRDTTWLSGVVKENGSDRDLRALAREPDGDVLLGGIYTSYNGDSAVGVVRVHQDGSLDPTFISHFDRTLPHYVYAIAIQPDGRILIGGWFTEYDGTSRGRIARLQPDGTLDTSFDPGSGFDLGVNDIAIQPDGKIVVGGDFTQYNGAPSMGVVRLNIDGTTDPTFNTGPPATGQVLNIFIEPSGKILLGGKSLSFGGSATGPLVRLNADGSLDSQWPVSTVTPSYLGVNSISQQADGQIIIVGEFRTYLGYPRHRIARLNNDFTTNSAELSQETELRFYPNPTESTSTIASALAGTYSISVSDITGRLAFMTTLSNNGISSPVIDLSAEPDGVYLIKLSGTERTWSGMLVKQ